MDWGYRLRRALGDLRTRFSHRDPGGDPSLHLDRAELDHRLLTLPAPPSGAGTVGRLVVRGRDGHHGVERVRLSPKGGVEGDAWARGKRKPEAQISVMRLDVAEIVANGQPVELAGDNLLVDLNLSLACMPIGARVRVGTALCEVTPKAHTGCARFSARFGKDALAFVNGPDWIDQKLRGLFLRVLEEGEVAVGDAIFVAPKE